MRKIIHAAVAALLVVPAAGGCRAFCGDCPSRSYRYDAPPVIAVPDQLPPPATVPATPVTRTR